jgi:hypothetical protein
VFSVRYELYLCVPYGPHNKQRLFLPKTINRLDSIAEVMCLLEGMGRTCVSRMVLTTNSINRLVSVAEK